MEAGYGGPVPRTEEQGLTEKQYDVISVRSRQHGDCSPRRPGAEISRSGVPSKDPRETGEGGGLRQGEGFSESAGRANSFERFGNTQGRRASISADVGGDG